MVSGRPFSSTSTTGLPVPTTASSSCSCCPGESKLGAIEPFSRDALPLPQSKDHHIGSSRLRQRLRLQYLCLHQNPPIALGTALRTPCRRLMCLPVGLLLVVPIAGHIGIRPDDCNPAHRLRQWQQMVLVLQESHRFARRLQARYRDAPARGSSFRSSVGSTRG